MVDQRTPRAKQPRLEHGTWKELKSSLPLPPRPEDRADLLWQEVEAHFGWYDRAATRYRYGYLGLKLVALVAGASVTVLAASAAPPALTASLAALVVIVEGAQQLFQCHRNWLSFRATAETIRRHALLYVADVKPYDDPSTRRTRLGDFLRELTAVENDEWVIAMEHSQPAAPSS